MKKKGHTPTTRVKNPEPHISDPDWIIWAAWADRITFEEKENNLKGAFLFEDSPTKPELKMAKMDYLIFIIPRSYNKCINHFFEI